MTQMLEVRDDGSFADAPRHCGEPMMLRETTYTATPYGVIPQPLHPSRVVELVWACACGFQLSYQEPAELALPLSPKLRAVAAAAAEVEAKRWRLDQVTIALENAVLRASDAGSARDVIAGAADLRIPELEELTGGSATFVNVG
jgi:hypothetical protein